ncbi:MAG TPA: CsbD family protein [Gemmatimonadales bacterium]|nr:CsbD family protein [Gemmatimonadales bacterium]
MKRSTKNRVRGKVRQIKGKAKETAGRARGDTQLEAEGLADQITGTMQELGGQIQKDLEDL